MADYNGLPDSQLRDWLVNFATVSAANAATLGLTPAQVTLINQANTNFGTTLANKISKTNDAKTATLAKNDQRHTSLVTVRTFANQFQHNPNVTDQLIQQLGLNVHNDLPSKRDVFVPTGLVATGAAHSNDLVWKRNGNFSGTVYMIESQLPGGEWELLDSSTKARYSHTGTTPGVQISYRVYAQRATKRSVPSNVSTVWSDGIPGQVSLKAA